MKAFLLSEETSQISSPSGAIPGALLASVRALQGTSLFALPSAAVVGESACPAFQLYPKQH